MKNILFVSSISPFDSIGGVERYLDNLTKYLKASDKRKVYIMLPKLKNNPESDSDKYEFIYSKGLSDTSDIAAQSQSKVFSAELEEVINEHKIDVISAENFHIGVPAAFSLALNMVAGLNKVALVLRLHSFSITKLQSELVNQLGWDRVSTVSRSIAGDSFSKGADVNRLATDYLGVNTESFVPSSEARLKLRRKLDLPQDSKIITIASRIIFGDKPILKKKGFIATIRAFAKIKSDNPDARLVIAVGRAPQSLDREYKQTYKKLLGYLLLHGIDEETVVREFDMEEMPQLYQGSDLFVLPSENETFGQVYIEAMASGIPVIGTRVGGIPEIITDGRNGYLINPGDTITLSQKMQELLNNDDIRSSFIEAGLDTVSTRFTMSNQFDRFFDMIEKL